MAKPVPAHVPIAVGSTAVHAAFFGAGTFSRIIRTVEIVRETATPRAARSRRHAVAGGAVSALPTHPEGLAALAAQLPCRVICGEEGPYLSRYTLAELPSGGHVYLHFFHRGDVDRELHSHPWTGRSIILAGGYREERRYARDPRDGGGHEIRWQDYRPGDESVLAPDTFHRVDLLDPERGCWTLFTTGPRVESWGFWDRDSGVVTPWREQLARRGLVPTEPVGALKRSP